MSLFFGVAYDACGPGFHSVGLEHETRGEIKFDLSNPEGSRECDEPQRTAGILIVPFFVHGGSVDHLSKHWQKVLRMVTQCSLRDSHPLLG